MTNLLPPHQGLNADWSVCAWLMAQNGDDELWLLENESDGTFEVASRQWDDASDLYHIQMLETGIPLERVLLWFNK